jgi:hypothetical protein
MFPPELVGKKAMLYKRPEIFKKKEANKPIKKIEVE